MNKVPSNETLKGKTSYCGMMKKTDDIREISQFLHALPKQNKKNQNIMRMGCENGSDQLSEI